MKSTLGSAALVVLSGCTGGAPESGPPRLLPDELPSLVGVGGQSRTLEDYVRPGLDEGRPTILWVTVQASGEVATWVGLDAPWRGEGCAEQCYEVEAPSGALASLGEGGPPALVAIDPEAPMGDVVGVLRSLDSVGIDAHLLVAADGKPPTDAGTAGIEVLPGRVGKAESCGGRFHRQVPFSEAVTAGCDAVVVDVYAANAPGPATPWGLVGMGNRRFRCTAEVVDVSIEGIPEDAIRPDLEPWLHKPAHELARCAMADGVGGALRLELSIVRGVPVRVVSVEGPAGPFAECAGDVLGGWRFTTDATGGLTVGLEATCTPR